MKHAYYITCERIVKDPNTGEVTQLHCRYDPDSRGGWTQDGRRVMGTLHWVSAAQAVKAEVQLVQHLFNVENPLEEADGREISFPSSIPDL